MDRNSPRIYSLSAIWRLAVYSGIILLFFCACSSEIPSIKDYDFDKSGYRMELPRSYSRFINWKHGKLHYVVSGNGPSLILIHGLGGAWDNWKIIIPMLSAGHMVYALDLPGFGLSDKPEISYTIPFMVDAVKAFMDETGLEQADFAGHSLGGQVLMDLALKHPEKIRRMILLDSTGIQQLWEPLKRLILVGFEYLELHPEFMKPEWTKSVVEACFFKPNDESEKMIKFFVAALQRPEGRELVASFSKAAQGILKYPMSHRLSDIKTRTLVVWGQNDGILSLKQGIKLNRDIIHSQLKLIPQCGHIPHLEKPEILASIMLEYFGRNDRIINESDLKTPDYP